MVSEVTTELYKNASPTPDAEGQQGAEGQDQTNESSPTDETKTN